jgi:hypothetical protein
MTLTTDGSLNVDISGATINVNMSTTSPGGVVKAGVISIPSGSASQLPDESVSQGVQLAKSYGTQIGGGEIFIGGVSGNNAIYNGFQLTTSMLPILVKVTNLNQLTAISSQSGAGLAYFGIN